MLRSKRTIVKLELLLVASLFLFHLSLINDITNKVTFFTYFPKSHSLYLFIFTVTFPLFAFLFASYKLMCGTFLLMNFYLIMTIIKLIHLPRDQWQLDTLFTPALTISLVVITGLTAKHYRRVQ